MEAQIPMEFPFQRWSRSPALPGHGSFSRGSPGIIPVPAVPWKNTSLSFGVLIPDFLARTGIGGMLGRSRAALGKVGNSTCPGESQTQGSAPLFPDFLLDHPGHSLPWDIPWDKIPDVPKFTKIHHHPPCAPRSLFQDMKELFPLSLPNPKVPVSGIPPL